MQMTSSTDLVSYHAGEDHVATITINRPEKMNALNAEMLAEIKRLWQVVRDDDKVHAVVLRASGEKAFSTGLDRVQGFKYPDNVWNKPDPGTSLDPKHHKVWKPVVCAVNGTCAGGAFYLVGGSDIVIASTDATFFDPHVDYGLVAALEPISMMQRMPLGEVLRISLLGLEERMSAERARQIGLVSEVVDPEKLHERAHELARRIAGKPSVSTQGTVRAIWEALDAGRTQALERGLSYTQIGNPIGLAIAENLMKTGKRLPFEVR
ncbi:enoyl-CoA hydratase/isomerase family protein [Noviherbaspirillum sedimenti]|uniref:Enoyl-CoA hydratase/isomerase family protein n=2 Tax=Noviherbaspirillum sedimenti TaxID=2320865 RepID=A0A3A3FWP7_9BURK|nr:enoyl-CoA hydratase/isomerase family protein [Noviherbaspirillum sedimenti]